MFALLPVKVAGLFYVRSQGAPFLTFACRKTKKAVGKRIAIQDNNNTNTTQ